MRPERERELLVFGAHLQNSPCLVPHQNCFSDTITVYLSAMYAKLLVTLGIAFPITVTISDDGKYYQVTNY